MRRLFWAALFLAANAWAQAYPTKPIRIVVPLVPGGNQDIVARAVAEELSKGLGQQVMVENRPGQSAIVGTQFVKAAPADGYTLLSVAVIAFAAGNARCWVKLTGVYRISTAPGFADAAPLAQALIAALPGRLIWGSDYPHLSFGHVHTDELFALLASWAPQASVRSRILEDNPAQLFGF